MPEKSKPEPSKLDKPKLEPLHDNPWMKKMQTLLKKRESGEMTDAEFERRSRHLFIELQARANQERAQILAWALETKKVRDEAEYRRLCKHYHDEYGDSFHHFLTSIYHGANFLTMNPKVLDDARLLELRFGGKIVSPEQALAEVEAKKEAETQEPLSDD